MISSLGSVGIGLRTILTVLVLVSFAALSAGQGLSGSSPFDGGSDAAERAPSGPVDEEQDPAPGGEDDADPETEDDFIGANPALAKPGTGAFLPRAFLGSSPLVVLDVPPPIPI